MKGVSQDKGKEVREPGDNETCTGDKKHWGVGNHVTMLISHAHDLNNDYAAAAKKCTGPETQENVTSCLSLKCHLIRRQ